MSAVESDIFAVAASEFRYRPGYTLVNGDLRLPAEGVGAGTVHELAVHPVRLGGVPLDLALEPRRRRDLFGKLFNRDVGAVADIDDFRLAAVLHEIVDRVRHIIDVEKLTERFTCTPEDFFRAVFFCRFDKTPDQGREDMPVHEVVGVVRAVEIAGHETDCVPAVLFAEVETEFVTGNLCQRIAFIGRFQRAGQEIFFLDRLRCLTRIDAARSEEAELFDLVQIALHDHVVLDFQVFEQEFRAVHFVGHDSADLCAGKDYIIRLFRIKELLDGLLIAEIELGVCPFQDIGVTFFFELADTSAADHSAMAADKDFSNFINHIKYLRIPVRNSDCQADGYRRLS